MPACQMIGSGYIMDVCLSVDAVQVLSPGLWVQGLEKLFYSIKVSYSPVQLVQREGGLCVRDWHLSKGQKANAKQFIVLFI